MIDLLIGLLALLSGAAIATVLLNARMFLYCLHAVCRVRR